jgi:hypothetical protein
MVYYGWRWCVLVGRLGYVCFSHLTIKVEAKLKLQFNKGECKNHMRSLADNSGNGRKIYNVCLPLRKSDTDLRCLYCAFRKTQVSHLFLLLHHPNLHM